MAKEVEAVSWRKALILGLVLLLVGGLYLWDKERVDKGKAREEEQKRVFPWKFEDVTEVSVQRASGPLGLAREGQEGWLIREPVKAKADPEQVRSFVDSLLRARKERMISEEPKELSPYGLDAPEATIRLKGKGPDGEKELLIGKKNPTEVFYYASLRGEKPVFLIYDTVFQGANRQVLDLRDKSLWGLAAERVRGISIMTGSEEVSLRKEGDRLWKVESEEPLPADSNSVEALLFRLSRLRAVSFEDDASRPLGEMGLDPPVRRVVVRLEDPQEEKVLEVGSEAPSGSKEDGGPRLYVRVVGGETVGIVDARSLGEIPSRVEDWRDKTLLVFEREKVERLEIRRPEGLLSLRKGSQGQWEIEGPERLPADSLKVSDLLWALKDARVARFLKGGEPNVSWERADLEASLWLEGTAEPLRLLLAGRTPEGDGIYARAPSQSSTVVVSSRLEDELRVPVKEVRDRRLWSFDNAKVQRIQVNWEGRVLELARKGDGWKVNLPEGNKGEEAEAMAVSGLLWTIREVKFEEVLVGQGHSSLCKMDKARVVVSLWTDRKEEMGPLVVCGELPDRPGMHHAWLKEESAAYLLGNKFLEDMKRDLKDVLPDFLGGRGKG